MSYIFFQANIYVQFLTVRHGKRWQQCLNTKTRLLTVCYTWISNGTKYLHNFILRFSRVENAHQEVIMITVLVRAMLEWNCSFSFLQTFNVSCVSSSGFSVLFPGPLSCSWNWSHVFNLAPEVSTVLYQGQNSKACGSNGSFYLHLLT